MSRLDEIRARIRARRRQRRGVALILVLGSLVILTVLVTDLQEQSSSTLSAALAERDAVKAEYHARSGVSLSRLLLATEGPIREKVRPALELMGMKGNRQIPVWKFTNMVLGPFNCPEKAEDFERVTGGKIDAGKNMGTSGGCFDVRIIDEDAKINVNGATAGDPLGTRMTGAQILGLISAPQYMPMFEESDADGQYSNQPTICGAIVDWSDPNEAAYPCDPLAEVAQTNEGPEDNFYQSIGLPYTRKNAPFDSLHELKLVRGISDDFWTTFVEPDPNDPDQRVFTVWGQGGVNVNTANAQTLLAVVCAGAPDALLCNDPEQMSIFLMAITLAREVTQGAPIFTSGKKFVSAMRGKGKGVGALLAGLGLEPVEFKDPQLVQKSIKTESKVFSIYADGIVPGRHRETLVRIHSVVDTRSALEVGQAAQAAADAEAGAEPAEPAPPPDPMQNPQDIAAALASDPLGVIIYHRIE